MSRRVLAPVLLLLAAACSIAAVFAVHRIETGIGPLSQPSIVPPEFSPNGDGVQDEAYVYFTVRGSDPNRISLDIADADGTIIGPLLDRELLRGTQQLTLTGYVGTRRLPDGSYRVQLRRPGDGRVYEPTRPFTIDTRPPIGILDRATLELGELRGLAMLGAGERLEVFSRDGDRVEGIRQFSPNPAADSAQPVNDAPDGTFPVRFTIALDGTPERIDVVDKAGNRRQVFPDPDVDYRANG